MCIEGMGITKEWVLKWMGIKVYTQFSGQLKEWVLK